MNILRPLLISVALLAGSGVALAAKQSSAAERNYHVSTFDKVTSAGSSLVIVHVGGAASVSADGPAETLDKMEAIVEDGELRIRPKREFRRHFDWRGLKPATFTVTLPHLTAAALAGSGDMRIDRAEGERFAASVAGSGNMDIATLRVNRAAFNVAGSGNLTARGSAGRAEVSVAGSGDVQTRGVTARTAAVSIVGSGGTELTAKDTVSISIIGSGDAVIAGPAHCTVTRMGSGKARCGA